MRSMANEQELKEKISELEHELAVRDAELHRYRLELERANLTLEKMIDRTAKELRLAQGLQKLLSPTEIPPIQGFEFSSKFVPGTRFGGDYFDIFEHEDRLKFGVLVSSASGYGLSSLLLMALIKMSSQMEARRGLSADKVMQQLTEEVGPLIDGEDRASLFYGVVDRRSYELQYCALGEMDIFIQGYSTSKLDELEATGPHLAKGMASSMLLKTVQLNPRDRLIIATEGLRYTENPKGVRWGSHGLAEAIRKAPRQGVHELRNEILFSNERYSQKEAPMRDQTVIVTEVKDRVIKLAKT